MRYRVRVLAEADHELRHLPGHIRQRVRREIAALQDNPRPAQALELRDLPGFYRIRLDRYRLVYVVEDDAVTVWIVRTGPKEGPESYEGLPLT